MYTRSFNDCKLFFRLDSLLISVSVRFGSKELQIERLKEGEGGREGRNICSPPPPLPSYFFLSPHFSRGKTLKSPFFALCSTEVAFDIKQAKAGQLHSFLSFLPETSKLQSAVYSEWK